MSIIGKVGKLARQAVVSDSLLEKTVSPLVNKSVEGIENTLNNNVKVSDVLGINSVEAKDILEKLGFHVSVLEVRKPNKKYAKYKVGEIVDMEFSKPNVVLGGIPRGSVVKIFVADEEIISKSGSWMRKVLDND